MKENQFYSTYIANCVANVFLCFTAISLNGMTIHAIRKTPSLPRPLKTLLLNLVVSDLSVGLLVHPSYIALLVSLLNQNPDKNTGHVNTIIIAWGIFTANFISGASFFGVMALTADRFLAIHLHHRYHELVTHRRVVVLVVTIMVFDGFVASIGWWTATTYINTMYTVIEIVCLSVIAILYCKIYLTVRRHKNQIQSLQVRQEEQNGDMTALNVARHVKLVVGTFYVYIVLLVCWLPQICLKILLVAAGYNTATYHLSYYSWTMILLNSSLNPLIYCWKMRHIRHTVINILQNIFPCYN